MYAAVVGLCAGHCWTWPIIISKAHVVYHSPNARWSKTMHEPKLTKKPCLPKRPKPTASPLVHRGRMCGAVCCLPRRASSPRSASVPRLPPSPLAALGLVQVRIELGEHRLHSMLQDFIPTHQKTVTVLLLPPPNFTEMGYIYIS